MNEYELRREAASLIISFIQTGKVDGSDLSKIKGGNIAEVLVKESRIVYEFLKNGIIPS